MERMCVCREKGEEGERKGERHIDRESVERGGEVVGERERERDTRLDPTSSNDYLTIHRDLLQNTHFPLNQSVCRKISAELFIYLAHLYVWKMLDSNCSQVTHKS